MLLFCWYFTGAGQVILSNTLLFKCFLPFLTSQGRGRQFVQHTLLTASSACPTHCSLNDSFSWCFTSGGTVSLSNTLFFNCFFSTSYFTGGGTVSLSNTLFFKCFFSVRISQWRDRSFCQIGCSLSASFWNRTRPRALVQNQHTRELISAQKTSHKQNNTDLSRLR